MKTAVWSMSTTSPRTIPGKVISGVTVHGLSVVRTVDQVCLSASAFFVLLISFVY